MKIKNLLLIALLGIIGYVRADGEHWTWNPYQYGDNATFIAVISIDGEEQRSDQLEIAAFHEGECRGSIICEYVPLKDRYFAYFTMNGENGMEMVFRLWDHATETEPDVTCDITYTFVSDDINGLPSNPFVFPFTSNFQGSVFTGSVSALWSETGNWSGEALPDISDNILINAPCELDTDAEVADLTVAEGAVLTVQSGKTLTVTGTLTNSDVTGLVIKDGAQLINGTADVMATFEKDIVGYSESNPYGWYTMASPMDNMPIAGSDFLTESYDLYRFNETNLTHEEWENYRAGVSGFTTFESGRGYLYANSNTFSPGFTGVLNNAAVSQALTCTDRPNDELDGFNLIGNPFPHAIYKGAGGAIDNASFASGYYTLSNDGAWQVHTYDEAIMPGQGILMKTTEAMTIEIAKSNAAATAECASKAMFGRLRMNVSGEGGEDRAFVYFGPGIGLEKMLNFAADIPSLSVLSGEGDYAIAHVDGSVESLGLRLRNTQAGTFTLSSVVEGAGFIYLHLIDHVADVDVDLLQQPEYSFTATGEEPQNRFTLMFTTTCAVTAAANPAVGGTVTGEGSYYYGAAATLTATANEGYTFTNWTKDGVVVSVNPTYSFIVTEMGNYVANFARNSYEITVVANSAEGGTVTGEGTYYYGTTATLTATANEGYTFTNWTKDGVVASVNPTYSFIVTGEGSYVANFILSTYTVTAITNPSWGGEIIGGGTFSYGETVSLQVVPNDNFVFVNWTENGEMVSEEATYTFTVTEACTLVAHLEYHYDGVESYDNVALSVYPNPVSSMLTVEADEEDFRVEVFSMTGERLYGRNNCAKLVEINVSDFAVGAYILRLTKGDVVKNVRFVKR